MPGIPGSDVASVRFFIDGKPRHLARTAPYLFAGRGNLLLPGTLGSGSHIFAVDVTLTDGRHLTTAATAVVSAQARGIPRRVLGRWTRTVTVAEVARTQSFRNPADGVPLPAGTWQVRIGADGVARYTGPAQDLTVGQVLFEPGVHPKREIDTFARAACEQVGVSEDRVLHDRRSQRAVQVVSETVSPVKLRDAA